MKTFTQSKDPKFILQFLDSFDKEIGLPVEINLVFQTHAGDIGSVFNLSRTESGNRLIVSKDLISDLSKLNTIKVIHADCDTE